MTNTSMVAAGIEHAVQAPAAATVAPVSDSSDSSSSDEELDAPNPVMGPSSSSAAAAAAAADQRENVSIEDQIQRQKLASFLDEDSSTDAEEEDMQIKGEPLVVNEDGNATEDKNVDPLQPRDEKMSLLKADEEVEVQGEQVLQNQVLLPTAVQAIIACKPHQTVRLRRCSYERHGRRAGFSGAAVSP